FVDSGVVFGTSISVLYGDPSMSDAFGIVPVGSPGTISGLERADIDGDAASDLIVVTSTATASQRVAFSVGVLFGRSDKTMISPFVIDGGDMNQPPPTIDRVLLGRFVGGDMFPDLLSFNDATFWLSPGDGTGHFSRKETTSTDLKDLIL